VPRFDIPENLWERFDRRDPNGILREVEEWGWDAFLNDVVSSPTDLVLYDQPGDFQLVEREDLFSIHGFDESMLLGFHVDTNLFRRLSLLYDGAATSDLADRVLGYHCEHILQPTLVHNARAPVNDPHKAVYVTQAEVVEQARSWGLAGEVIEELSLAETPAHHYLQAVRSTLAPLGVGAMSVPQGRIDYDERHVLPFVLNVFVNAPRTLTIAWVGTEPVMFRLFAQAWRAMGFTGPLLVPEEFAEVVETTAGLGTVRVRDALSTWLRAEAVIFDFAQRTDLRRKAQAVRNRQLRQALESFCTVEQQRLTRPAAAPRRVVAINAMWNYFQDIVRDRLDCTVTPYSTHVRTGTVTRLAENMSATIMGGTDGEARAADQQVTAPGLPSPADWVIDLPDVFDDFEPFEGLLRRGFAHDFIGSMTRSDYRGAWVAEHDIQALAAYPELDQSLFEWVELLESVRDAGTSYSFVELGAGYGRWAARAAVAARRRGILKFRSVLVEAEPQHATWARQHMEDNGVGPDECVVFEAAVGAKPGRALFAVDWPGGQFEDTARDWYGQFVVTAASNDALDALPTERTYHDKSLFALDNGIGVISVEVVTLSSVLANLDRADLVHIDIQGTEADLIVSSLDILDSLVARLCIATQRSASGPRSRIAGGSSSGISQQGKRT
jgi:FkbM family methyltransferase